MDKKYMKLDCVFDRKSYEKLNSQFAKVRIRIAYDGLNRNGSIIPKELLEKMSKTSLFNIPIVGEYSEEKNNFLGHGGKLEISDEGFKFIDTTRPYGVVPSDSEIYWETIKDKNGYDEHEYLCCTGILWHSRYPEIEKILDDGANHSMELQIIDGEYTDDYKFLIKDAEFSALCILGRDDYHPKDDPESTNVEPCFEDSCITRYTAKDFKFEFALMLEEYKQFNLNIDDSKIQKSEGVKSLLDKNNIFSKLKLILSELKFKSNTNKHYEKYIYLSHDDNSINLIDREDCYKLYSIPYFATESNEELFVNIDYENKEQKSFIIGDKTETEFNIQNEIEVISLDFSTFKVSEHQSAAIDDLSNELDMVTNNYNNAQLEISRLKNQLQVFEEEKRNLMEQKHKETIDVLIDSKYDEMKDFSEYSIYRADINYAKSIEQISKDIKDIHYNFLSSKKTTNKQHNFSGITTTVINDTYDVEYDGIAKEYGVEIAKYFKKN